MKRGAFTGLIVAWATTLGVFSGCSSNSNSTSSATNAGGQSHGLGGAAKPAAIDCSAYGTSCSSGCALPLHCFPTSDMCLPVHGTTICSVDMDCPDRAPICLAWTSPTSDATCVAEPEFDCVCAAEPAKSLIPRCAAQVAGTRVCMQGGGICDAVPCCAGSTCVDGADGVARCQQPCQDSTQCATGCCHTVAGSTTKICTDAFACCQGQNGPCADQYCCTGYTCAILSSPAATICKLNCTDNSECSTGCCAQLGSSTAKVCLDASYCRSTSMGGTSSTGGTAATGGAASTGGTTSASSNVGTDCSGSLEEIQISSGLCVAKMVTITGPASDAGTTDYKIDATEVTRGQYATWLATNPGLPASTDANCGWNTSYTPSSTCNASASSCQTDCDHLPQECVDWCDAFAYCAGVGKRLCGAIGGGSNSYASFKDPNLSQWHRACTSGGRYLAPYANTPDITKCNEYPYWGPNYDNARTLPVGSLAGCQSPLPGYAGVYDQDGNVWEWEDSCDIPPKTACRIRGVGFQYYAELTGCAADSAIPRTIGGGGLGIRCCSQ